MHAMVCTGVEIAHVVSVVSICMSRLGKVYWQVVKWILGYLKELQILGLNIAEVMILLEYLWVC